MDIGAPPVSCIVLNLVPKKQVTSEEILTVGYCRSCDDSILWTRRGSFEE